eukprot:SAG31_NODE_1482_length_8175_cov_4.484398_15_plen_102_part_00
MIILINILNHPMKGHGFSCLVFGPRLPSSQQATGEGLRQQRLKLCTAVARSMAPPPHLVDLHPAAAGIELAWKAGIVENSSCCEPPSFGEQHACSPNRPAK